MNVLAGEAPLEGVVGDHLGPFVTQLSHNRTVTIITVVVDDLDRDLSAYLASVLTYAQVVDEANLDTTTFAS